MELLVILGVLYGMSALAILGISTALRQGERQNATIRALSEKVLDLEVKMSPHLHEEDELEIEEFMDLDEDDLEPVTFEEVRAAATSLAEFFVKENGGSHPEWLNFVAAVEGYIMVNVLDTPPSGVEHTVWNGVPVETTNGERPVAGPAM